MKRGPGGPDTKEALVRANRRAKTKDVSPQDAWPSSEAVATGIRHFPFSAELLLN